MRHQWSMAVGASLRVRLCGVACLAIVALGAAGVSSVAAAPLQTTRVGGPTCFLPKTKFLFHAGLAFGAFHRYISKPFKPGTFTRSSNVAPIAKAALAAAFIFHVVQEALKHVPWSHTLQV